LQTVNKQTNKQTSILHLPQTLKELGCIT